MKERTPAEQKADDALIDLISERTAKLWGRVSALSKTEFNSAISALDTIIEVGKEAEKVKALYMAKATLY